MGIEKKFSRRQSVAISKIARESQYRSTRGSFSGQVIESPGFCERYFDAVDWVKKQAVKIGEYFSS